MALFALGPILLLVPISFWSSGVFGLEPDWTLASWQRLLGTPLYAGLLFKSFRIAATTTALTLLAAFPLSLFLARTTGRWKAALLVLLFLPFWVGYVVRTFAWLPILGRNGGLNLLLRRFSLIDAPLDWLLYTEGTVHLAGCGKKGSDAERHRNSRQKRTPLSDFTNLSVVGRCYHVSIFRGASQPPLFPQPARPCLRLPAVHGAAGVPLARPDRARGDRSGA